MKVEIQRFDTPGGVLRVWLNPDAKHGDPYQLAMPVRWINDETVEFLGLQNQFDGPMGKLIQEEAARKGVEISDEVIEFLQSRSPITISMWKAMQDEAARQGIGTVKAVRMNTGKKRERWIKTKRRRAT